MNSVTLYRNKKTGDCLIQRYAGVYAVGKFLKISVAEMREKGLDIILSRLADNSSEKSELNTFSKEEERAFRHLHRGASIDFENENISLGILRRQGSGYVVRKEDIVRLSRPCTNEEFQTALNRVFTEF